MARKWKKAEKLLLQKQLAEEKMGLENVEIPGRTPDRIRRQAVKMKLVRRLRNLPLTGEQKKKLSSLIADEFSVEQVADFQLLGSDHSANALRKYLGKLNLVNKNRSLATSQRKIWAKGEKTVFDHYLRQNSDKYPAEEIAKKFGVKKITVTGRQRALKVKPPIAIVLAFPAISRRMKAIYEEKSKKILFAFENHILRREMRLEKLAGRLRDLSDKNVEERTCQRCRISWFKHRKFFYHAKRKTTFGTRWYFSRVCNICVARQRHQKKLEQFRQKYGQKAI